MQLKELANQLNISLESLQNFIFDFGIPLTFSMDKDLKLRDAFLKFTTKHQDFIKKYAEDRNKEKNIEHIAQELNLPNEEIKDFFTKNGVPEEKLEEVKTTISSYVIHQYIGGSYDFIYNDLPETIEEDGLIGYTDMFFYITDMLDPFTNCDQKSMWGITKPMGIILYGPPGSGKTFWAQKIAQMIGYEFTHVYKDYLLSTPSTHTSHFTQFLKSKINHPKTLLFIDDFEQLMNKDGEFAQSPESIELVNSVARLLQKDNMQELVLVGSVETLSLLNDEITAPRRFDLHLPIFPPNVDERTDLILNNLILGLDEKSPLLNILKKNNAVTRNFWNPISQEMKLFSNTMIIDFTQSIKKRIYAIYRKDENKEILLSPQLISSAFNESKMKYSAEYIKSCQTFVNEVKQNNHLEFAQRIMELEHELFHFVKKEEKINKIGFNIKN